MRITLEDNYQKIVLEVPRNDLSLSEVVEQLFRPAVVAYGYHPDSADKVLGYVDDEAFMGGRPDTLS